MLQAMNTGHDGSMSTAHANSPAHLIPRLEAMAMMSEDALPVDAVRRQLAAALDFVVHVARAPGGARVVTDVCTIDGSLSLHPIA